MKKSYMERSSRTVVQKLFLDIGKGWARSKAEAFNTKPYFRQLLDEYPIKNCSEKVFKLPILSKRICWKYTISTMFVKSAQVFLCILFPCIAISRFSSWLSRSILRIGSTLFYGGFAWLFPHWLRYIFGLRYLTQKPHLATIQKRRWFHIFSILASLWP